MPTAGLLSEQKRVGEPRGQNDIISKLSVLDASHYGTLHSLPPSLCLSHTPFLSLHLSPSISVHTSLALPPFSTLSFLRRLDWGSKVATRVGPTTEPLISRSNLSSVF